MHVDHLLIGGAGLIGTAVRFTMVDRGLNFVATGRNSDCKIYLDLEDIEAANLPSAETVYLVAAMPGFKACQGNPVSWQVNRDAPIALARRYARFSRVFIVFISSDVVDKEEWITSAYATQKREVEAFINSIDGAIIRPGKVTPDRVVEFANVVVDVGLARKPGVTRWR